MSEDECLNEEMVHSEIEFPPSFVARHKESEMKRKKIISRLLGSAETTTTPVVVPSYYRELLAWALHRHLETAGWKVTRSIGYQAPEPIYSDVDTGNIIHINVLCDGTFFVRRKSTRLAVTVDTCLRGNSSVIVTGASGSAQQVEDFASGVEKIVREQNFYRGRNLEVGRRLHFLDVPARSWDDIVLDPDTKEEIISNTIGFLSSREQLARWGIPARRGLLLVGKPGTGKTLICKALMAGSHGITCLLAITPALYEDLYTRQLYQLAQDLAPCIVFIEDIDLIARDRIEWGYSTGPALVTVMAVLDGIEENHEIVTVATTNHLETLDKAIGQRPSRFDAIIDIPTPNHEQRVALISALCRLIPMNDETQAYIARKTEGLTPAQVQEVVRSLAIRHCIKSPADESVTLPLTHQEVDRIIACMKGRNRGEFGFAARRNHDGEPSVSGLV